MTSICDATFAGARALLFTSSTVSWLIALCPYMSTAELLQKARVTREEASRAKRLARQLTQEADRSRLLRYAEDLEHQADDLERDAAGDSTPPAN